MFLRCPQRMVCKTELSLRIEILTHFRSGGMYAPHLGIQKNKTLMLF